MGRVKGSTSRADECGTGKIRERETARGYLSSLSLSVVNWTGLLKLPREKKASLSKTLEKMRQRAD